MAIGIIQDRLIQYNCATTLDEENALKEITQKIAFTSKIRPNLSLLLQPVAP